MGKPLNYLRSFGSIIPALFFLLLPPNRIFSQAALPAPDHIVILILENHSYHQIIGSSAAPYINSLVNDSFSAFFTQSYSLGHPSQPNYLDLYSGCNQGVINNNIPAGIPFTTDNLGRQLLDEGKTFITYSESLPVVGFNGASSGSYVRKHNAAANWMGSGVNQIPATTNQPFSVFPVLDYSQLPTVCFVIPNQNNDMHNGSDPYRMTNADNWINYNLDRYIQWARTHNSLFILTFDEDNSADSNHIVTIFNGPMVKSGEYADTINHYTVLRTIEDMYGLPYACNAATALTITDCWNSLTAVAEPVEGNINFSIYPNPAQNIFNIQIENSNFSRPAVFEIVDIVGHTILSGTFGDSLSKEIELINTSAGVYWVKISDGEGTSIKKLVLE
jgi:phosphatidylinositol-3-phosphatase